MGTTRGCSSADGSQGRAGARGTTLLTEGRSPQSLVYAGVDGPDPFGSTDAGRARIGLM